MTALVARAGRMQRQWPALQAVALVALFLYGSATISGFSTETSVRSMLVLAALLGLAAAGQTLVVVLGGIDLSVPGFIVAGAVMISELCGTHGWPLAGALAVIVGLAGAMGSFTGWVCHRYRIQPLIVTLGIGGLALGGVVAWTHGELRGTAPTALSQLTAANGTTFGLAVSPIVLIWAGVAVALGLFLHRTVAGRRLYATGANPRAAGLALVPTGRVWTTVFAGSAVLSALVGVLLAGFSGADQSLGDPYLFQGLTAVIVGGTTIAGARGDYTHTVLGALILTVLATILVGRGYDSADQQIIFGVLILIVVAGYGRDRRLRDRV
jgi:ribose transport system permease protein